MSFAFDKTIKAHGPYGFPFEPYPIQEQLMMVIHETISEGRIGILESPTGTGKSLSTICAAMSWLETEERRRTEAVDHQMEELGRQIKEAELDDDWMGAHRRKMDAQLRLEEVQESINKQKKVDERLEKAKKRMIAGTSKLKANRWKLMGEKRKLHLDDEVDNESPDLQHSEDKGDEDLIPSDTEECNRATDVFDVTTTVTQDTAPAEEPLQCMKVIYASRTHSQLEQFVGELVKTRFRPRTLTVGSRQLLCVNEKVRSLGTESLVDHCNELLNKSGTKTRVGGVKKAKGVEGETMNIKGSKCGCPFAQADAIENLADVVLAHSAGTADELVETGKELDACPYFGARAALNLSQLVLVPYNVLLHKSTRQAWQLQLKGNVVIIDEAHNLLQTLGNIHGAELSKDQLDLCCALIQDYIDRFRNRLSPRNFLLIRQLQTVALSLSKLLVSLTTTQGSKSTPSETVFTLERLMAQLNLSSEVDLFRLLEYLETSKLCRKLRDFYLRFSASTAKSSATTENAKAGQVQASGLDALIKRLKNRENIPRKNAKPNSRLHQNVKAEEEKAEDSVTKRSISSAPLYQLREFLEALTSRAEDARVVVVGNKSTAVGSLARPALESARFRFLLLNPAEKLRDLVSESRALLLLGGTMRPTDQLMDAFKRVCGVSEEEIVQFSCGHVIDSSQLIALSVAQGPTKCELNLNFVNRNSQPVILSVAQTLVNLIRHVPNGAVVFFPSYAFLSTFLQTTKTTGHFAQIEKVKPVFMESRGLPAECEGIWRKFCAAAQTKQGALLMAVVNGRLSEGINFSDELGRCVFMVGLPYPNRNSLELQERMKYVDETIGRGAGDRFYEVLCTQAVNQAIGRVIRHRADYAAIVLLDVRYKKHSIVEAFPGWIRAQLSHCQTFPEALSKLHEFFLSKRQL